MYGRCRSAGTANEKSFEDFVVKLVNAFHNNEIFEAMQASAGPHKMKALQFPAIATASPPNLNRSNTRQTRSRRYKCGPRAATRSRTAGVLCTSTEGTRRPPCLCGRQSLLLHHKLSSLRCVDSVSVFAPSNFAFRVTDVLASKDALCTILSGMRPRVSG